MNEQFNEPSHEVILKLNEVNGYSVSRRNDFIELSEQLDKLYHDIDAGILGDSAKSGAFYTYIKGIKDTYPKPSNMSVLKAELDSLIESELQQGAT